MTSTKSIDTEELQRAYALVQADLKTLMVFQVYLFSDGSVELSTEFETDQASFGDDLYNAVQNLKKSNNAAR